MPGRLKIKKSRLVSHCQTVFTRSHCAVRRSCPNAPTLGEHCAAPLSSMRLQSRRVRALAPRPRRRARASALPHICARVDVLRPPPKAPSEAGPPCASQAHRAERPPLSAAGEACPSANSLPRQRRQRRGARQASSGCSCQRRRMSTTCSSTRCSGISVGPNKCILFLRVGHHDEILQKPGRPPPCPYLPTYLPTLLMGN